MDENQHVIGFDTETELMGPENLTPAIVCISVSQGENQHLASIADPKDMGLDETIDLILEDDAIKVGCNTAYDLAVICAHRPELFPVVFKALEEGKFADIIIREKLLNLTSHGQLEFIELPGHVQPLSYSLASQVKHYLGVDLSEDKNSPDSWRKNYKELADIPSAQWPQDAYSYAVDDAVYPERIWYLQEEKRREQIEQTGIDPFKVERFRTEVSFCLYLLSARGMAVNAEEKARIEDMLQRELAPEKLALLVEHKILRPGTSPQPYANGSKKHVKGCPKKWTTEDGQEVECDCPPKMTRGSKESINKTKLQAYVRKLAAKNPDIELRYTAPTDKFPEGQLQVNAEWLTDFAYLDPTLEQYQARQKLQKLVTTEIPRMNWTDEKGETVSAHVVHPCFDVLKKTGRTSSFASKNYPSFNCQNVDPRVRNCLEARDGFLLFSSDYSQMELVTLGQKLMDLFGSSVLADKINENKDVHAYLGAQIAYLSDEQFRAICLEEGCDSPDKIYDAFQECKGCGIPEIEAFHKNYRTLAKPTGLGYPGGLGPDTFRKYAKATYGVVVDLQQATQLRDVWHQTFPEMKAYFNWITTQCEDTRNGPKIVKKIVKGVEREVKQSRYAYTSPMGLYRAGCDYCAAANGAGLQTPGAEGALQGLVNVVRACYDPSRESVLHGRVFPLLFVHDEIIGEVVDDDMKHECCQEIARLMIEGLKTVTPDMTVKAAPVLMRKWDKRADPVFDENGKLTVWEPKEKKDKTESTDSQKAA